MMTIGIIGAGKVGTAIGFTMKKKGLPVVAISDRVQSALNRARSYLGEDLLYTSDNMEVVSRAEIIAITTQDGLVGDVVREMDLKVSTLRGKLFFHTSGAHSAALLQPLDIKGALLGALHPLQTFPDIDSAIRVLPSTFIFVEGGPESLPILRDLGQKLGHSVYEIEGGQKVLYHLSAVFVCNLFCSLMYASEGIMEKIGVNLDPFFPIIKATLENIEQKGPLLSLTGPVVRGDGGTIRSHIGAMAGMDRHRDIYRALSLVALDMVETRGLLGSETLQSLRVLLAEMGEKSPGPTQAG